MGKFDEIFDDVVVNAKAAAAVVSKKASTVYDASKYKITAAEIRGEINKKLKDLGKYTYKAQVFGADTSAEISQTVAEIKELKENLDIINEHINSVKNQKKCPQCDAKIPKNSVFCNICGARIDGSEESSDESENFSSEATEESKESACACETEVKAEAAVAEDAEGKDDIIG